MKYVKPLKLYQELIKKNAKNEMMRKSTGCHRLLCLDICNKYLHLAVSNPDNTVSIPLRPMHRQENDMALMADKFRTLISKHKVMGLIVRYPYKLIEGKGKLLGAEVENFVCSMCKIRQLRGLKYTYWDDCMNSLDMDLVLNHHVEFICKHLNLSEEVSQEIMDKFYASRVLQGIKLHGNQEKELDSLSNRGYLDCVKMTAEIEQNEDKLDN